MRKLTLTMLAACTVASIVISCHGGTTAGDSSKDTIDSVVTELVGDSHINKAVKFYAGISRDGIDMTERDAASWDRYSTQMKELIGRTEKTRVLIDSLAANDFKDFRDKVDFVFYPFAAADFLYAATIFPDADTYLLCGLEKTGTPISDENLVTTDSRYSAYCQALRIFFNSTFFVTNKMTTELHNKEVDGVCPLITMLMAVNGREIISVDKRQLNENGDIVDATDDKGNLLEIKFFRPGTHHEQTLIYVYGDVSDHGINKGMKQYIDKTLPKHHVGTFLKAASYLLRYDSFSEMRDVIVNNSQYVIEDDSGLPYRFMADKFDITVYGTYKRPISLFSDSAYQPDLMEIYKKGDVKPLPFRIGYNSPSNWLCARKKAN